MGPCPPDASDTLILPTDDEAEEASLGTSDYPMMKAQQKQEQIDPVTTQTTHGTMTSEVEPSPWNEQPVDVNWTKGMRTTVGQGSTEIETSVAAAAIPRPLYLHADALLREETHQNGRPTRRYPAPQSLPSHMLSQTRKTVCVYLVWTA